MQIKIKKLHHNAQIPTYATDGSAAFDFYATNSVMLFPEGSGIINTGISIEVPDGFVLLLFSRSGHGFKNGIRLSNCVGVIDSDYRGEIKLSLTNDNVQRNYLVEAGERVAQGMVVPIPMVSFIPSDDLSHTERGSGGFGSTDCKN